jgi:hypothetical protein
MHENQRFMTSVDQLGREKEVKYYNFSGSVTTILAALVRTANGNLHSLLQT